MGMDLPQLPDLRWFRTGGCERGNLRLDGQPHFERLAQSFHFIGNQQSQRTIERLVQTVRPTNADAVLNVQQALLLQPLRGLTDNRPAHAQLQGQSALRGQPLAFRRTTQFVSKALAHLLDEGCGAGNGGNGHGGGHQW